MMSNVTFVIALAVVVVAIFIWGGEGTTPLVTVTCTRADGTMIYTGTCREGDIYIGEGAYACKEHNDLLLGGLRIQEATMTCTIGKLP